MYIVLCLFESRMRCRQACDGHAERRAAHVVQTCEVAELHRRRFAAVFAADAAFEVFACAAAFEYRLADQLSHAVAVEDLERVVLQNAFLQVDRQELGDVVAREAERHLCQVVGTEREEFGDFGDLVGGDCRTRNFDHRADHVFQAVVTFGEDLLGCLVDDVLLVTQLLVVAHQRHHDLHVYGNPRFLYVHSCLDDGPGLHLGNFPASD